MSLVDRPLRRSGWVREECGAAAIEFALVFPLFVMLTFGMISAGFAFFYDIQLTQAARDAARFGSTFPMESPVSECWDSTSSLPQPPDCLSAGLEQVADIAAKQTGWTSAAPGDLTDNGYICVAYFGGKENRSFEYDTTGFSSSGDPCVEVKQDGPQVQVVVERDSELNGVLFSWNLRLNTTSVIPWERRNTAVT